MAKDDDEITILRGGYKPDLGKMGYQPDVETRGYQPQGSQTPAGQNPPSGGSNVSQPPQGGDTDKQEETT